MSSRPCRSKVRLRSSTRWSLAHPSPSEQGRSRHRTLHSAGRLEFPRGRPDSHTPGRLQRYIWLGGRRSCRGWTWLASSLRLYCRRSLRCGLSRPLGRSPRQKGVRSERTFGPSRDGALLDPRAPYGCPVCTYGRSSLPFEMTIRQPRTRPQPIQDRPTGPTPGNPEFVPERNGIQSVQNIGVLRRRMHSPSHGQLSQGVDKNDLRRGNASTNQRRSKAIHEQESESTHTFDNALGSRGLRRTLAIRQR